MRPVNCFRKWEKNKTLSCNDTASFAHKMNGMHKQVLGEIKELIIILPVTA